MRLVYGVLGLLFILLGQLAYAEQIITIRLIDGRSGDVITNADVTLRIVRAFAATEVCLLPHGENYTISMTPDVTSVGLGNVRLDNRHGNQFLSCSHEGNRPAYETGDILSNGVAIANECNKAIHAISKPGEIIFFIRPFTHLESFKVWLVKSLD